MQWNPEVLDKYLAPGISSFTRAEIPDLCEPFPQASHWLANHFVNTVLRAKFKEQWRQVVLAFLRRAHGAFAAYHSARKLTLEYLEGNNPLNPRMQKYYDAVSAWEGFALQVSMAIDLFRWLNGGEGAFKKNDGSKEQRLYTIANHVKHTASCVESGQCQDIHTIPLWLTNEKIMSFEVYVTYVEASEVLCDIGKLADEYQDPYTFKHQSD